MDPRIQPLHRPLTPSPNRTVNKQTGSAFEQYLQEAKELKLSKHAVQRLHERKIEISDKTWLKIGDKMAEADKKGVDQSLVVLNEATLVVSSKNRTVVTAMDRKETNAHIFTNINGTIFINE